MVLLNPVSSYFLSFSLEYTNYWSILYVFTLFFFINWTWSNLLFDLEIYEQTIRAGWSRSGWLNKPRWKHRGSIVITCDLRIRPSNWRRRSRWSSWLIKSNRCWLSWAVKCSSPTWWATARTWPRARGWRDRCLRRDLGHTGDWKEQRRREAAGGRRAGQEYVESGWVGEQTVTNEEGWGAGHCCQGWRTHLGWIAVDAGCQGAGRDTPGREIIGGARAGACCRVMEP